MNAAYTHTWHGTSTSNPQARLDQVFSAYVNHHGEEERAQLLKDVDALFEGMCSALVCRRYTHTHAYVRIHMTHTHTETTDLQEKVNLFKYLPASLTLGHVVETLQIEKDTTPEAGVSKLLKTTLKVPAAVLSTMLQLHTHTHTHSRRSSRRSWRRRRRSSSSTSACASRASTARRRARSRSWTAWRSAPPTTPPLCRATTSRSSPRAPFSTTSSTR